MKASYRRFVLMIALLVQLGGAAFLAAPPTHAATSPLDFRNAMRELWEDHITWTRLTIVQFFNGDPEVQATEARLLQNQTDIGNAIKPYYGEAAGNQLPALLKTHITGAADVLAAAKAGDSAQLQAASTAWYANANDIAVFLHDANPAHWPLATLQEMMKTHLDQTATEAVANLKKDYPGDIAAYEAVDPHILMMADALSDGILAQFPAQFGGAAQPPGMPTTGAPAGDRQPWLLLLTAGLLLTGGWWLRRRRACAG